VSKGLGRTGSDVRSGRERRFKKTVPVFSEKNAAKRFFLKALKPKQHRAQKRPGPHRRETGRKGLPTQYLAQRILVTRRPHFHFAVSTFGHVNRGYGRFPRVARCIKV
jgi:hypothetical protein